MSSIVRDFKKGNLCLRFIGTEHTRDISDMEFIRKNISDFKPEIILLEDNFSKAKFKSEIEAIEKGGEMGFVSFIANLNKIKLDSNDPSFKDNILFLEQEKNRDFSFLYFFLRDMSYSISSERFDEKEIEDIIYSIKFQVDWKNYDFSIQNLKTIFDRIFNKKMSYSDYSDFFNPTLEINVFNEATRELNDFRDNFMLDKISKVTKRFNKVLIIKGTHHLVTMENKINDLFENE